MADIVIVGAGPVGLWTALQLKRRRPDWLIQIYERHEQYQRSHVIRLDHWSMLVYGRHKGYTKGAEQLALYRDITGKSLGQVALQPLGSLFIRTRELEETLRSHAVRSGIVISNLWVQSPAQLEALHPECNRFIAADGAHSRMRESLLGSDGVHDLPLQRVVEVKYDVPGRAAKAGTLVEQVRTSHALRYLAFAYVGKPSNETTPITLRVFVDDATYEALGQASFNQPLALTSSTVPAALRQDIAKLMQARCGDSNEAIEHEAVRLTKLTLSMYSARQFVVRRDARAWFLVGDAAMGVPYFRALNSGLILGSRLAQILGTTYWPISGNLSRQAWFYRIHRPLRVRTEFAIARSKNAVIEGLDWLRQIRTIEPEANVEDLLPSRGDAQQAPTSKIHD